MNETRELAKYLANTSYDDLPKDVTHLAKLCALDTIGVALFASATEWGQAAAGLVKDSNGKAESTVIGTKLMAPAQLAALANGTMSHGFELDDIVLAGAGHPGSVIVPASLAVAEKAHADGKTFLAAVVLGYETMTRVGAGVGHRGIILRGFHNTGTNGPFGAAASAGKIIGLDEKGILNALGICGSLASGIMEFSRDDEGTMVKRLHAGRAAEGGITAAFLAAKGFTGPSTVLEGKYGYCHVFCGPEGPEIAEITKGLGREFHIRTRWVKAYACCGSLHPSIDAVLALRQEANIDPAKIDKITIGSSEKAATQNSRKEPKSIMAAQYSVPFVVALSFLRNIKDPRIFNYDTLEDREALALASKVDVVTDPEIDALEHFHGSNMVVKMIDGREYRKKVIDCKGMPENPLSEAEVVEKFRYLVGDKLPSSRVATVIEKTLSLEKEKDLAELGRLLQA